MNNIKIISNGMYLPKKEITNEQLAEKFEVSCEYIFERTGIKKRYYSDENIEQLAKKAVDNLFSKMDYNKNNIDMIIVASTSTNQLMPGISYQIQRRLKIKKCICMDILAGCSGYINAFDIARSYIVLGKVNNALVIGCEVLSKYINQEDLSTAIILSDGAGATLIGKSEEKKQYESIIESNGDKGEILTCAADEKIYMDGKAIYKYAVTDTVKNIEEILKKTNTKIEEIKYIIPHQSNIRIIKAITERLGINSNKMYTNIEYVGNTFCASIPIALNEIFEKDLLKPKDKIILIGYGGGLNLGSILMEV